MPMAPRTRKLALTAHVSTSVGWLGAVAASVGLAVVAMVSNDAQTVRGVYVAMEPLAWFILVPLSAASLLTGLVQSLGTPWGLVRHYWVVLKLIINLFASVLLLMYTQTLGNLAADARDPAMVTTDDLRSASPLVHAAGAMVLLVLAVVLSIYKPRGLTRFGRARRSAGIAVE